MPITQAIELFSNEGGGGGGGGNVTGSGSAGQVAFFSAIHTIAGDNGLFWDNTNKFLGIGTTTPSSILHLNGSLSTSKIISSAINYSVLLTDYILLAVPVPPAHITFTLPLASSALIGKRYILKDAVGAAAPGTPITLAAGIGDGIDGVPSLDITVASGFIGVVCTDNTLGAGKWAVIE